MSSSGSGTVINSGSGTVINSGSGSDFLTSYGCGSTSQKVTVPMVPVPVPVPVPQHCWKEDKDKNKKISRKALYHTVSEGAEQINFFGIEY